MTWSYKCVTFAVAGLVQKRRGIL